MFETTEDEFQDDQKTWFDPKNEAINAFFWKGEEWMKDVMKHCEQAVCECECDKEEMHADSRSRSSNRSTTSTTKCKQSVTGS